MLAAKKFGTPIWPIAAHALVHASMMFVILLGFTRFDAIEASLMAAMFQFLSHWLIDIGKGMVAYYFPVTTDSAKRPYWVIMGLDQLLHQIVIVIMVYIITNAIV